MTSHPVSGGERMLLSSSKTLLQGISSAMVCKLEILRHLHTPISSVSH